MNWKHYAGAILIVSAISGGSMLSQALHAQAAPKPAEQRVGVIAFKHDSDEVTPAAKAVLDAIAAKYPNGKQVAIRGHSDASEGSSDYGRGLSQRRAGNVRAYLASRRVPDGVMTTEAWSTDKPAVPGKSPKNRRVEIFFTAGSGW